MVFHPFAHHFKRTFHILNRMVEISVIIPTLNEKETLGPCIDMLNSSGVEECIVVDGGSRDGTEEIAVSHSAQFIIAPGGKGAQCNAGASRARGKIYCFLHADTKLPADWRGQIIDVIHARGCAWGAFRFGLKGKRPAWRLIEAGVNWRSSSLRLPYGDQAIFVRREVFDAIGGFKTMPFMEDVDFVFRLRQTGPMGIAYGQVLTSPRRWEQDGVLATTFRNYLVLLGFILGIDPKTLYRWYSSSDGRTTTHAEKGCARNPEKA